MSETNAHWGFLIDEDLLKEAQHTLSKIREASSPSKNLNLQAAKVVSRLTEHGLNQYYHRPTEMVPLPKIAKKAADTGINIVMSAINVVIRQFFKKRTDNELKLLGDYLNQMLWEHPERGQPYLIFSIPGDLKKRALILIERAQTDKNTGEYIAEVVDALSELVGHGVVHYYEKPTRLVSMGGMTRKTADMGINTAQKGIRKLIKKLVSDLDHPQLAKLSYHIESMIHIHDSLNSRLVY